MLICARLPFFERASQESFKEGVQQSIHLKEDDPSGFELFVPWLYRRCLPTMMPQEAPVGMAYNKPADRDPDSSCTYKLGEYYLQAEELLLPNEVKTAVLDEVATIRKPKWSHAYSPIPLALVNRVVDIAPEDSPLRTFVLDSVFLDFVDKDSLMVYTAKESEDESLNFDVLLFLQALREHFHFHQHTRTTMGQYGII